MQVLQCWHRKNNWSCTDDSPFTDCNQTQFCCQWQWKFSHSVLLAKHHWKWSCLAGASTCFRIQGTVYRVWSPANHTKRSVSAGTWYLWLYIFYQYWGNIYPRVALPFRDLCQPTQNITYFASMHEKCVQHNLKWTHIQSQNDGVT